MKVIFKASKMISRIKDEGRGDMLDDETVKFINLLDGKEADTYNWQNQVMDKNLAYISPDKDQDGTYVNVADCV
jgi:hypothetical protein